MNKRKIEKIYLNLNIAIGRTKEQDFDLLTVLFNISFSSVDKNEILLYLSQKDITDEFKIERKLNEIFH